MTDLTLEQLREKVRKEGDLLCRGSRSVHGCCGAEVEITGEIPIGVVLNEIGIIFLERNDEAEADLAAFFNNTDPRIGSVAYFYLSQRRSDVKQETLALIKQYETNSANAAIVARAKKKIKKHASKNLR